MRLCLAIVALMLAAAPAAAGPCCGHATYDVQPVVPVSTYRFEAPEPVTQIYVANQGPVFSGPGLYTYTNRYVPSFVPTPYPYVSGYDGGWRGTSGWRCGCGAAHAYQTYMLPGYDGYRGHRAYHGYRGYRSYRHHPAPLATNILPSRGY